MLYLFTITCVVMTLYRVCISNLTDWLNMRNKYQFCQAKYIKAKSYRQGWSFQISHSFHWIDFQSKLLFWSFFLSGIHWNGNWQTRSLVSFVSANLGIKNFIKEILNHYIAWHSYFLILWQSLYWKRVK